MSEPSAPVPTPRYHRVLGASFEVSRGMRHSYVGVEHLFLAMIHDRDAVPAQVLAGLVDLDAVESALLELMNSDSYKTDTTKIARPDDPPANVVRPDDPPTS